VIEMLGFLSNLVSKNVASVAVEDIIYGSIVSCKGEYQSVTSQGE
jgi:hypothetical protein